jgi:hypothetical protein
MTEIMQAQSFEIVLSDRIRKRQRAAAVQDALRYADRFVCKSSMMFFKNLCAAAEESRAPG